MDVILKGDICYSKDKDEIAVYEDSYVICQNGKSKGVFRNIPEEYRDLKVIDHTGKLILPGMTDLHIHAPQYSFRGMGMDLELLGWLDNYAFKEEAKYADLSYAEKAYTIFADALKRSATTRAVVFSTIHREATELLMEKLEESGISSYVGKLNMDRNAPENYIEASADVSETETERWIKETKDRFFNTFPIITPRFVPSCSDALLEKIGRLAEVYRLKVQSHLSENPSEVELVHRLCPDAKFYGDQYDRFHLFGGMNQTVMAHCIYSTDEEIALMKKNGVFIAHCPSSNMNVTSGIAPIRRYLDLDMKVGLGSDVAGGNSESIFRAITDAIQNSKLYFRLCDPTKKALSFDEGFYLSTKGGGEFFGKVGSFEDGYEFDALVLFDSALPHPQPLRVKERLERAVYLGADEKCLVSKFCKGKKIF